MEENIALRLRASLLQALEGTMWIDANLPRVEKRPFHGANLALLIETDPVSKDAQHVFGEYLQKYLDERHPYPDAVALAAIATELLSDGR